MELRGERVVLRDTVERDTARILEIGSDPAFARWWPDLGDEALAALLGGIAGAVPLTITLDGTVIGLAQFYEEDDPEYRHAGIDLGLAGAWQDQGLGTDAVRTLARYLVHDRGHHRLVIDPVTSNARAIRCYEKVGFKRVGVLRRYQRSPDGSWDDGLLMDLLADELT